MPAKNKIFLSILSGMLLSVAFPPFPVFITAFIAFIPLFIVIGLGDTSFHIEDAKKSKPIRFRYIYITFFIYHLCSNWWISTLQENSDPYLFMSGIALDLLHPIFFMFPFVLLFVAEYLMGKKWAMWLFPFFWTIFEWLHSIGDMGYSWLSIAHTQFTNIYWYQIIDLAGIWGPVFLIMIVNVLIFYLIQNGKNENGIFRLRLLFRTLQKKIIAVIIYAILVLPMVYGFIQIKNYDYNEQLKSASMNNKFINIGLIQPNINPWDKWESSRFKQIQTHLRLQDSLINTDGCLNLCIWSETAIPMLDMSINRDLKLDFLNDELYKKKTSILTGIAYLHFFQKGDKLPVTVKYYPDAANDDSIPFSSFNSAILLNPIIDTSFGDSNNMTIRYDFDMQIHNKSKLTPFAEGFPYVEYLSFAKDWLRWGIGISAWTKANETKPLEVRNDKRIAQIAPVICIESVYPDFVRKFVLDGANIIAVITNDAWYDYSYGPEQHYIIAATRAIENRRYLARCANSGVTGFISPSGKTIFRAEQYKETAISASIPIIDSQELTLYTRYGDFLPEFFACIVVLIFSGKAIFLLIKKNRK